MSLWIALVLATQIDAGTICQAIKNQWEIRMVVREDVVVNSKEIRFMTHEVTMKPYEVGTSSGGVSFLKGEVVDSHTLKETKLRTQSVTDSKRGWFYSPKGLKEFKLSAIDKLEILTNAPFEAPGPYKEFGEKLENVCSLPTKEEVHILK